VGEDRVSGARESAQSVGTKYWQIDKWGCGKYDSSALGGVACVIET